MISVAKKSISNPYGPSPEGHKWPKRKNILRSQLKSISGTPMSNLSRFPAKNITAQAHFIFGVPKWGSSPPRGAF